ncbi:MAG: hypothetical protein LUO95_06090 [Methylococcaceae bacterium]|nr:hypothetical protein [Methylococcaceae bacterium]MDD1617636.1 hypothetical protein [Methylococcaceae bacterium]
MKINFDTASFTQHSSQYIHTNRSNNVNDFSVTIACITQRGNRLHLMTAIRGGGVAEEQRCAGGVGRLRHVTASNKTVSTWLKYS